MYPLTPLTDVIMSRNHEALARAIERFDGRKFDYTPRNQFEEKYANYPATVVERMRNEVSLSALRALVTHMGSLREGRKAVILVSEGYTNYLPPQLRDPIASMPGLGNPARGAPMAGVGEDRERFFSGAEMISELKEVYSFANRNNTAIYALDPRGLAPFEFDINEGVGDTRVDQASLKMTQDSLRILADETDGRAIVNQNDLDKGLRQILSDSSVYYLLGYNSSQAPQDGKFHEIKVPFEAVRRAGAPSQGLLGAHRGGDCARAGAPGTRAAEGVRGGARVDHAATGRSGLRDPHLDRDVPRRERPDARHLRLGARAPAAGCSARGRRARQRDGARARTARRISGAACPMSRSRRRRHRRAWVRRRRAPARGPGAGGVRRLAGSDAAAVLD